MLTLVTYCFRFAFPFLHDLLLFIAKNIILYLSTITIPININIIPNCSFQVNYTLFDNKVIIDKVAVYNKKLYIAPFAIPLFEGKIKRLYLSTPSGFVAINDLNIYDIKNSPIDVEINNISLYEVFHDDNYKNSYINGKASMKINGNTIQCKVTDFIIKNVKVNDINIGKIYLDGNYETTEFNKNLKCNIKKLTINNSKFKDNIIEKLDFSGAINSKNIQEDIDCNINKLIINNIKMHTKSGCEAIQTKSSCEARPNNSVDSLTLIGSFNSTNIKKNINFNIEKLNINNLKLFNNTAENIYLQGSGSSKDIKKELNCDIKELMLKNIKVDKNSAENIHLIGNFNSNDIKNNLNCNIKELNVKNIKIDKNSASNIQFSGVCSSNDINKCIDCNINNLNFNKLKLKDINIGDVKFYGNYKNNNINCKLDLINFNHNLLCNGKLILGKNPKLDLLLKSNTPLILNNFKINNDIIINTNCQYNTRVKHYKNNNTIDLDIKTSNNIVKGINLGNILLQCNYNNDKINCKLDLNKWKHLINCNGILKIDPKLYYNLNINCNNSLVLNNLELAKNLPVNLSSSYKFNINNHNNKLDINGNLKLNNCSIAQYLNNINANINLNKNIININNLNANIPSFVRGKLNINGNINMNSANNIKTNCNIKLVNGVITNIPVIKGTVDIDLNLTGNIINDPLLKGDIIIRNPKADLTPVLSGAMLSSSIIEKFINKKPKNKNNNKITLSPINTNINIKIDKILEANGPGLETTWKGGASIQCKKGKPIDWNAQLNLIKGKYTIANKKLKLTSGECIANPNIKGLFTLMLAGKKKSNNDVVELKFIQKQNNTQIEFFSQPMKSKQDILALLLFDKYSSELSSAESYSLAMTIQSLTSGKGSIFSKVQDTFKIDTIELKDSTDKSGDEYKSISIGKKIGKWKVNVERGKDNSSFKGSIERKLFKNIKASVGASKDNPIEASLVWSKRY